MVEIKADKKKLKEKKKEGAIHKTQAIRPNHVKHCCAGGKCGNTTGCGRRAKCGQTGKQTHLKKSCHGSKGPFLYMIWQKKKKEIKRKSDILKNICAISNVELSHILILYFNKS